MESDTFSVYPTDEKDFDLKIRPDAQRGRQLTLFCSFTYITPNYSILFTLEGLRKFTSSGNYKVILVIWDMNTLANPYFRRLSAMHKIPDAEKFIEQKIAELRTIAYALGFDKNELLIYKSSELWKRLISYKEENLFQQFYSILAQMKIRNYSVSDKLSHLMQIPMDLFFCNYFHRLYPEDLDREIDLVYFGQNKEKLYALARELMLNDALIKRKNPIFVLMKGFPYLIHNDCVPEWDMSLNEIRDIIIGCNLSNADVLDIMRHLCYYDGSVKIKSRGKVEEISYESFNKQYSNNDVMENIQLLAENLERYLRLRKERYLENSSEIEESILSITRKQEAKNIGSILKSVIALEILLRSDGTRNSTKIARELGKSVATIGMYVGKLKRMGLVRMLPNGNLKRNIKGVKINLELGM